jgi:RNA polymerase sigma-B factor
MTTVAPRHLRQTSRPPASASLDGLFHRWQEHGDQSARAELCRRFAPLARKLAARYRSPNEPLEDLVQVASLGLIGAIDRFDPSRGISFTAFAVPTILGELKRHFRSTGWAVHVPRGAQEMAMRVDRAVRQLSAETGRAPRVDALAEFLEVPVEDVLLGLEAGTAHYSASLDAPAPGSGEQEPQSLGESLGDVDHRYGLIDARLSLSVGISQLPYAERRALTLRLGHDMRQTDIARELGCSQMQVSRLLRRAGQTLGRQIDPDLPAR